MKPPASGIFPAAGISPADSCFARAEHAELDAEYDVLRRVEVADAVQSRALEVQAALARRGYHRGPSPVDLLAAAAAERADAELWHCDRHFELIAEVTRQPVRRIGR